jgi:hypothetical protein
MNNFITLVLLGSLLSLVVSGRTDPEVLQTEIKVLINRCKDILKTDLKFAFKVSYVLRT